MNSLLRVQLEERFPAQMAGNVLGAYGSQPPLYYQPVMTSDGDWIQPANLVDHLFHAFVTTIGLEDIDTEERFVGAPRWLADEDREELRERMLLRVRERSTAEWMDAFRAAGNVAAEPCGRTPSAFANPDLVANEEVVEVEHPRLGLVRQLGLVARLIETPGTVGGPAPEPGEHTSEVLGEPAREAWTFPADAGIAPAHPLEGVTVLEFATVIAAPLGAALLADLGARVIKVEPPGGDSLRGNSAGLPGHVGAAKTTAGKESICLDLKQEEGRAIVGRLLEGADVLIHNYRPGVPERLGIGYELARERSPGIVHVSVNGYGPRGPSAARPSAHPIPGAVIGGALQQAGPSMPPEACDSLDELREAARWLFRSNEANPDPKTSMVVASASLLGLYARRCTGVGQRIFVSMLGANTYANADAFVDYEGARATAARCRAVRAGAALPAVSRARGLGLPRLRDGRVVAALRGARCGRARRAGLRRALRDGGGARGERRGARGGARRAPPRARRGRVGAGADRGRRRLRARGREDPQPVLPARRARSREQVHAHDLARGVGRVRALRADRRLRGDAGALRPRRARGRARGRDPR